MHFLLKSIKKGVAEAVEHAANTETGNTNRRQNRGSFLSRVVSEVSEAAREISSSSRAEAATTLPRLLGKRTLCHESASVKNKRSATSTAAVISAIKSSPVQIDLTTKDIEVGIDVMRKGGASATEIALIEEVKGVLTSVAFDAGFAYHHLNEEHKKTAKTIIDWANNPMLNFITSLVSDSSLASTSFKNIVMPLLLSNIESDDTDPNSLGSIASKGIQRLEMKDIKHLATKVKHITPDRVPAEFNLDLEKLKSLLVSTETGTPMSKNDLSLKVEQIDSLCGVEGTFLIQGNGKLPEKKPQPFNLIYMCSGEDSAMMFMTPVKDKESACKEYLIPIVLTANACCVNQFVQLLEKNDVIRVNKLTINRITPGAI
ncbi:MAG: hypothetical protein OXC48_05840 [Endozoicomonadaceae bacterium]|nr:hypothetical protein [Endozoicomonadaceae bacterium]